MTDVLGENRDVVEQAGSRGALVAVGLGLGVFGAATYLYLGLAGRALGEGPFAPLSVLWSLLNAVGIGLFLPFEQELGRRTALLRVSGEGNAAVARRAFFAAGALVAAVAVLVALGGSFLAERLFAGQRTLVLLLVFAMAGMALAYLVRGLLSGSGRFGHYGAQLAVDGIVRVAASGALARAGVTDAVAFGAVLAAAPVVAVLATTPRPGRLVRPGPAWGWRPAIGALGTLVAASLASQALANAGPVAVALLAAADEEAEVGRFTAALVIARVPLFLFAAVQAVLLPGLAGLVGAGDAAGFRRRLVGVSLVTGTLGLLGVVGVFAVGPDLVPVLFGAGFATDRAVITLIASSGASFMLAQIAAQALLALDAERAVVCGWVAGLVVLGLAALTPGDVAVRAAWALLAGSSAALVGLALATVHSVRRRWPGGGRTDG